MSKGLNFKYVFIGGAPRSGTTLFQKILDNHSNILGGPEFDHLPEIIKLYNQMQGGISSGRQRSFYSNERLDQIFRDLIRNLLSERAALDPKIGVISEKTPKNVFAFKELSTLFPEGLLVGVIRDPRAVLLSFKTVFSKAKSIEQFSITGMSTILDMRRIMKANNEIIEFSKLNEDKCMIIHYEDLVTNPTMVFSEICKRVDIPFELNMIDVSKPNYTSELVKQNNSTVLPYTTELNEKSISTKSVNRWKDELGWIDVNYANHIIYQNVYLDKRYSDVKTHSKLGQVAILIIVYTVLLWELLISCIKMFLFERERIKQYFARFNPF